MEFQADMRTGTLVAREWICDGHLRVDVEADEVSELYRVPGAYCMVDWTTDGTPKALRPLALYSGVAEKPLSFLVRFPDGDIGEELGLLRDAPLGLPMAISVPRGGFQMPRPAPKALYLVATGSGYAPMRSVLHAITEPLLHEPELHLVYGYMTDRHNAMGPDAARWAAFGVRMTQVVAKEPAIGERVQDVLERALLSSPSASDAVVCVAGQPGLVRDVAQICQRVNATMITNF